jgi:hypothetical protein
MEEVFANVNYFVGSLEQTMQRANGAVIYGPAPPAAIYPARPPSTSQPTQLQAYIEACQAADELRDAQFPHGGPALNHRPLDSELKTILVDALTLSIAARCIQEPVPAVLQPEPQREDLHGPLQRHLRPGYVRLGRCQVQHP